MVSVCCRVFAVLALTASVMGLTAQAADVSPSKLSGSQDDTPVLTLHGPEERRTLSRADIESVPLHATTLQHFAGPHGRFAGVWLKDLMAAQGIDETATLRFIAHDDYTVFISPEDLQQQDYLLVTRLEGEPLTLTDFGPTMLIVPAEAEAVEAGTASMTHWIWSIRAIFVQ
nr:molybdopterin-dependent oxidoreductase [Halomonas sp.]